MAVAIPISWPINNCSVDVVAISMVEIFKNLVCFEMSFSNRCAKLGMLLSYRWLRGLLAN